MTREKTASDPSPSSRPNDEIRQHLSIHMPQCLFPTSERGHFLFFPRQLQYPTSFFGASADFACVSILSIMVAGLRRCFFFYFFVPPYCFYGRRKATEQEKKEPKTATMHAICAMIPDFGRSFITYLAVKFKRFTTLCVTLVRTGAKRATASAFFTDQNVSRIACITREERPHQQSQTHSGRNFPHFIKVCRSGNGELSGKGILKQGTSTK